MERELDWTSYTAEDLMYARLSGGHCTEGLGSIPFTLKKSTELTVAPGPVLPQRQTETIIEHRLGCRYHLKNPENRECQLGVVFCLWACKKVHPLEKVVWQLLEPWKQCRHKISPPSLHPKAMRTDFQSGICTPEFGRALSLSSPGVEAIGSSMETKVLRKCVV